MTEVKSLHVTADSYRHRGWVWNDRGAYEIFKPYMKLPLWIDRILTNRDGTDLYAVGKTDGFNNTIHLGPIRTAQLNMPESFPEDKARYHCRIHPNNGFRVLAERIRAKKPDVNKMARPSWRQPMKKPWEPGTLGSKWVIDSSFVKEVRLDTLTPPTWADRLWVSTSGGTDTFLWVNSVPSRAAHGKERHQARNALGIIGSQRRYDYPYEDCQTHAGCHWQLAGVRKKTAWVPEPEVVKPELDVPMTATTVRSSQDELSYYGTDSGRIPHLNPLLAAPYGKRDIYKELAENLGVSRGAAKVRLFRNMYTRPFTLPLLNFDLSAIEATAAYLYGSLALKPPIGVKPRNLHDEERANALDEAMVRYLNEDLPFPIEWAIEWNELRARLNKEQK